METAGRGPGGRQSTGAEVGWAWSWACCAVAACVAAVGLAGAGVLVWWAVAFHPAREQLWMVPVGLVLLGTPLVAWLSLFASGACRRLGTSLLCTPSCTGRSHGRSSQSPRVAGAELACARLCVARAARTRARLCLARAARTRALLCVAELGRACPPGSRPTPGCGRRLR
ncbi:uncharacterized protein LOC125519322 [Triticum urartu]|uniref:uncharacterized protein LOC125519322 n=1 Tax=Triticum urartu TaxID=4572 RepID=UPI002043E95D|nr:uncharacterized protein LOC125519322 [Triticum urartu]